MKKLILSLTAMVLLSLGTVLAGEGISFTENKNWKAILAQAKKENKLIFLDAYASWCGPCKYLQSNVFTDKSVGNFFNSAFINAKIDMEEGEGPALSEELGVTAYPTLFFINGDGKVVHKYVGALDPDKFIDLGKDALNPQKQYYTLKSKAEECQLSAAEFHNWIHAAEKFEDKDAQAIITSVLVSGKYKLMDKEMLKIIFDHAVFLTEPLLEDIKKNSTEIKALLELSDTDFKQTLTTKAVSFATKEGLHENVMDFNLFKQRVARYSPEQADLETQKLKVKYYFNKEEDSKGLNELAILIDKYSTNLPGITLASQMADFADEIVEAKRGDEFIAKINRFKLSTDETAMGYYKDFAMLIIYHHMKNEAKVTALTAKINNNDAAPEKLKEIVNGLGGEE